MSYLILFICGILSALQYVFDSLFFLPYFTVAALFITATRKKAAYRHGLCFFLGYYLVVYHWFVYLYPLDFAGFTPLGSIPVILVAWVGMSLMQGVGCAFIPFVFKRVIKDKHRLVLPFAAASLWCIAEWAQNLFWFGVPWARLALTQHRVLPIVQSASLFGSLGVGFLIVLVSGFIALAYLEIKDKKKIKLPIIVATSLFAANFIFGVIHLNVSQNTNKTFSVAVIQGNIGSADKWADDSVGTALEVYSELSQKASGEGNVKLIVWPETVLITSLNHDAQSASSICTLSKELNAYILVGAFYTEQYQGDYKQYNSLYLFNPDGTMSETVYHKRHLVPFGEYVPMQNVINTLLPFLSEINMLSDPLTEGTDPALFNTDIGKLGSLICFDSIYESLTLTSVREGAELIVLSTNDSWYKDSAAVYQHNAHAVLRAIENGRYVVRSANTGVSSIISDKGVIKDKIPPLLSGYAVSEISTSDCRTLYSYIGNTVVYLSLSFIFILFFEPHFKKIIKKHCHKKENGV